MRGTISWFQAISASMLFLVGRLLKPSPVTIALLDRSNGEGCKVDQVIEIIDNRVPIARLILLIERVRIGVPKDIPSSLNALAQPEQAAAPAEALPVVLVQRVALTVDRRCLDHDADLMSHRGVVALHTKTLTVSHDLQRAEPTWTRSHARTSI